MRTNRFLTMLCIAAAVSVTACAADVRPGDPVDAAIHLQFEQGPDLVLVNGEERWGCSSGECLVEIETAGEYRIEITDRQWLFVEKDIGLYGNETLEVAYGPGEHGPVLTGTFCNESVAMYEIDTRVDDGAIRYHATAAAWFSENAADGFVGTPDGSRFTYRLEGSSGESSAQVDSYLRGFVLETEDGPEAYVRAFD